MFKYKVNENRKKIVVLGILVVIAIAMILANVWNIPEKVKNVKAAVSIMKIIERDSSDTSNLKIASYGLSDKYIKFLNQSVTVVNDDKMDNPWNTALEARKQSCQYLLCKNGDLQNKEMESIGFEELDQVDGYSIYKNIMNENSWIITQYATVTGNQSMFYTLFSDRGKLIVVDGGYVQDSENVRNIVSVYGNQVDLWIASHFHDDHIGAITEILSDQREMEIEEIWCPDMESSIYDSFAKEWDSIDTCHKFLNILDGKQNVKKLKKGEEFTVDNLKFEIFTAFDIDDVLTYAGNNCGLMFKVTGANESMLFCTDIGGTDISKEILTQYGGQIKSDYIQMGHHGNGGMTEEFYRMTEAKVAFFDAPDSLFNDTSGKYTTPANRKIMEDIGSTIYYFKTAPNRIMLK